jgi:hypothetical protein
MRIEETTADSFLMELNRDRESRVIDIFENGWRTRFRQKDNPEYRFDLISARRREPALDLRKLQVAQCAAPRIHPSPRDERFLFAA